MCLVRRTLSTCPLTLCRCTACVACSLSNASRPGCSAFFAFCACYVFPMLRLFVASGGAILCCTHFAWSVQEKLSRRSAWLASWPTLSVLYTLRKLECYRTIPGAPYSRPICTERAFQARWKELVAPVELDPPVATVLPKATRISWPFASWVTYILSRPGLVRSINRSSPWTSIVQGDAYPVAGGNWTQLTISLANFARLARSPAGPWVLSMANCDDKAMDTLGTLWKSNWEVLLSPSAFHSF